MKMQKNYYICKGKFDHVKDKHSKYKKYCKVRDPCHYTGEYRGAAQSKCNLKYNVPKKTPIVFNNGYKYNDHLIIKELAEEFEGEITCFGENTKKYLTLSFPVEKQVIIIVKKWKMNHKKLILTNYNLLLVQDSCQVYYQILLIMLLKEFIKLNVNMDMIIKKMQKV